MGQLTFITGGARSGKSRYGEDRAKAAGGQVTYIATAIPFDEGMRDRIKHHRESRPAEWPTIEQYRDFENLSENPDFISADVILLDCLTVLTTNLMMDYDVDYDTVPIEKVWEIEKEILRQITVVLDVCKAYDKETIIVANEVGLGLVPAYKMGSYFRDIAGRVNQMVAARADEVYFTVSGIPMKIK